MKMKEKKSLSDSEHSSSWTAQQRHPETLLIVNNIQCYAQDSDDTLTINNFITKY